MVPCRGTPRQMSGLYFELNLQSVSGSLAVISTSSAISCQNPTNRGMTARPGTMMMLILKKGSPVDHKVLHGSNNYSRSDHFADLIDSAPLMISTSSVVI